MSRKIFLSFTGTMRNMNNGEITQEDLRGGLFYFGCTRQRIMDATDAHELNEVHEAFSDDMDRGNEALSTLRNALVVAEEEGRVAWRSLEGYNTQKQLSELLVANGAQPLNSNLPWKYEYDFIAKAISRVNNKGGLVTLVPVY